MNPIQDFQDALKQFRQIAREIIPDPRSGQGWRAVKKFSNLEEFRQYHLTHITYKGGNGNRLQYKKKTPVTYKKRGITSKITVSSKENPSEYQRQYQWFRNHPEAEVYAPKARGHHRKKELSDISRKITVDRKENLYEYNRQYHWFRNHPEAEVYAPRDWGREKH